MKKLVPTLALEARVYLKIAKNHFERISKIFWENRKKEASFWVVGRWMCGVGMSWLAVKVSQIFRANLVRISVYYRKQK